MDKDIAFVLFVKALGFIFEEMQGVVVYHEDKKFFVMKENGQIKINLCEDDLKEGQKVVVSLFNEDEIN